MTTQNDDEGISYVRGLGTAFIGLFKDRGSIIHQLVRCGKDDNTEREVFSRRWYETLFVDNNYTPRSDEDILNLFRPTFHTSPIESRNPIFEYDPEKIVGRWINPCSNDTCGYYIDLALPPSREDIIRQVELAGITFFKEFLEIDLNTRSLILSFLQESISAAFNGIPHFSILYRISNGNKYLCSTSIGRAEDLFINKILDTFLSDNRVNNLSDLDNIKSIPINTASLIKLFFPTNDFQNPQLIRTFNWGKKIPAHKQLLNLLCWDRIGRQYDKNGEPVIPTAIHSIEELNSLIRNAKIKDVHQQGIFYHLSLSGLYYLAASAIEEYPAFLLQIPLCDHENNNRLIAFVLVPNYNGLHKFLKTWHHKYKYPNLPSNYWEKSKTEWEIIGKSIRENFEVPKRIGEIVIGNDLSFDGISSHTHFIDFDNQQTDDSFVRMPEELIKEKLEFEENQIWILKAVNTSSNGENPKPEFRFIITKDKRDSLMSLKAFSKYSQQDINKYIDDLESNYHKCVGIVGQTFESLRACKGISVLGDLRTLYHMGAHGPFFDKESKSDGINDGVRAEVFFYVSHYKDYYCFPIVVSGRLWGLLEFEAREYVEKPGTSIEDALGRINRSPFLNLINGIGAAKAIGNRIEEVLFDCAERKLHTAIKDFVLNGQEESDDSNKNLISCFSDAIKSYPCIVNLRNVSTTYQDKWNEKHLILEHENKIISLDWIIEFGTNSEIRLPIEDRAYKSIINAIYTADSSRRAFKEAEAGKRSMHYLKIEKDLEHLIKQISSTMGTAQKIDREISFVKTGFLIFPAIDKLLNGGQLYFKEGSPILDNTGDIDSIPLKSIHSIEASDGKELDYWRPIAVYLQNYGRHFGLDLYKYFKETDKVPFAVKQFNLLKLAAHYSKENEPLYGMQVLLACLESLNSFNENDVILDITSNNISFNSTYKENKLDQLFKEIETEQFPEKWFDIDAKEEKIILYEMKPAKVLSSIMTLIQRELKDTRHPVKVNKLHINSLGTILELIIYCVNEFDEASKLKIKNLEKTNTNRGLRAHIVFILDSVRQKAVEFVDTIELETIRKASQESNNKFYIGCKDGITVFYIGWKKGR